LTCGKPLPILSSDQVNDQGRQAMILTATEQDALDYAAMLADKILDTDPPPECGYHLEPWDLLTDLDDEDEAQL